MDRLLLNIVTACVEVRLTGLLALMPGYRFKVGKTTQTLANRFSENYEEFYDDIELLYDASGNGELIDAVEKDVIEFAKETYPETCDNEQVGGGPNCVDSANRENTAKLYVVWKKQ